MSLETTFYWLSEDVVRFKIEVGVEEKCKKYNTVFDGFSAPASTARRTAMSADNVIIVGRRLLRTYREARM